MNKVAHKITFESALEKIRHHAASVDAKGLWPAVSMAALLKCGALAWSVPRTYGGIGMPPLQIHRHYGQIASACLTTALILTQRDAAVEFLAAADANHRAQNLLRKLATHRCMVSIGISQVTTSTRHGRSALVAVPTTDGFRLDGVIPWATSVHHCTHLVAAADAGNGNKLVFILPLNLSGVIVHLARPMAVLNGSDTASVQLAAVSIARELVLAGPAPDALKIRARRRRFTLNTCVLPLGVAAGALADARVELKSRSRICRSTITKLHTEWKSLASRVYQHGMGKSIVASDPLAVEMRAACNHLAMRCALAALELAKGRGLQADHAAQRRVREAMFFFVWSSPTAVIEQTLSGLVSEPPIC
jgi:butyryl-CoA dehydrogenase